MDLLRKSLVSQWWFDKLSLSEYGEAWF